MIAQVKAMPRSRVRPLPELFALAVLSWILGIAAYALTLVLIFWELPGGDTLAVAVWSAFAFFPLLPIVHIPASWLVHVLRPSGTRWPLAVVGVAVAPLCVILATSLGGSLRIPELSPENFLFFVLFAGAGGVFAAWAIE